MDVGASPDDLDDCDRLFGAGGPWPFNTKMSWDFLGDYRYIEGFRSAAEALGDRVAEDRGLVDVLAMPILFCIASGWSCGSRNCGSKERSSMDEMSSLAMATT